MSIDDQMMVKQEKDELNKVLQHLINSEEITQAAEVGIAKLVIAKGFAPLSEKQKAVYEKRIKPLTQVECETCDTPLQAEEIIQGQTKCSCQYSHEKCITKW